MCCLQGCVSLPNVSLLPDPLMNLLTNNTNESKEFRKSIRLYNSIWAFTSVSANIDEKLLEATTGTFTYRINGAIHYKMSIFILDANHKPEFSQIYIYDSDMQSSIRTGMYPLAIKANILNIIQSLLNEANPYVKIYQQVGEMLRIDPSQELNIILKNITTKDKTLNKPTANEIAVLMIEYDSQMTGRISQQSLKENTRKPVSTILY